MSEVQITADNFKQSRYYRTCVASWGMCEYPLWDHYRLCPRARYVAGVSNYLCECLHHHKCPGVLAAANEAEHWDK